MKKIILTAVFGISLLTGLAIAQSLTDTNPNLDNPGPGRTASYVLGWNGATWTRLKTFALANMPIYSATASSTENGRLVVEKGSRWSVVAVPGAGTQAIATIAAEANVRHVVDCISWAADSSGAVTAAGGFIAIRNGATGVGPVMWAQRQATVAAGAAGAQVVPPQTVCGLQLVGSTNTAMTAEFAAGVVNSVQTITMTGFNTF